MWFVDCLKLYVNLMTLVWRCQAGLAAPDLAGLVSSMIGRSDIDVDTLEAAAALLGRDWPALTARTLRAAADLLLRTASPADTDWDRVAALQAR